MSVSGILSSSMIQQMSSSQFQQLGSDLASGNLSSAQSDFATLQAAFASTGLTASTSSTSSATSSNPLAQAFQQLSSDLQSGNLTGAQKDYSTIQQDMQSQFSDHSHFGHAHKIGQDPTLSGTNPPSQDTLFPLSQSASALASRPPVIGMFDHGATTPAVHARRWNQCGQRRRNAESHLVDGLRTMA